MTRSIIFVAGAALLAVSLGGPAFAQGVPQTVTLMKVDPASLATGYRTSKVVGSIVVNEANETVGTIDDLIVTPAEKVPFAVPLSRRFPGHGHEVRSGVFQFPPSEGQEDGAPRRHRRISQGPSGVQV